MGLLKIIETVKVYHEPVQKFKVYCSGRIDNRVLLFTAGPLETKCIPNWQISNKYKQTKL